MRRILQITLIGIGMAIAVGCKRQPGATEKPDAQATETQRSTAPSKKNDHGHDHTENGDHEHEVDAPGEDHSHDKAELGTVMIGDLKVSAAQGHGAVSANKEGHLVVKLPYSDKGATVVRAWIGTEDRTASYVGKGTFAPSHDDYDVHAMAPDPLPADLKWWIEIEKPDGTTLLGSVKPILE